MRISDWSSDVCSSDLIWEAVYVIEGLMQAKLSIEPDTVYSDTQGQSATVFAFTYLLGINLLPRIRNWKDLDFFRADKQTRYAHIDSLDRKRVVSGKSV